jgi:hypothetical protein
MATQLAPGEVKPGWTTTEFWQTLLVQALTASVAIGAMFKSNFNLNGVQAVVPAVAVLAAALAQAYYSHSRAVVKAAAQNSAAQVVSSSPATPPEGPVRVDTIVPESNGAVQHALTDEALTIIVKGKGIEIAGQN